jgi:hypothetical protein
MNADEHRCIERTSASASSDIWQEVPRAFGAQASNPTNLGRTLLTNSLHLCSSVFICVNLRSSAANNFLPFFSVIHVPSVVNLR